MELYPANLTSRHQPSPYFAIDCAFEFMTAHHVNMCRVINPPLIMQRTKSVSPSETRGYCFVL
jgi:hypothetical protein